MNDAVNVRLYNLAVGDSARKIEFYQNRSNSGGSKIKPQTDQYFYTYDSPKTIQVPMISLDDHIRAEQLPSPNGIIMDIEGAEHLALKGMPQTLTRARFLYIEYVPHHLQNVSGVTNDEFFALLLPHFDEVRFMRSRPGAINLKSHLQEFKTIMDGYFQAGQSDDLLFTKAS
jgi:FkbM family methyltransferase